MGFVIKEIEREKVELILKWCEVKFGKSKHYKKFPKLRIYKTEGKSIDKSGLCGTFGNRTITIYLGSLNGVKHLCETVIHEYKHFLLGQKSFRTISTEMIKKGKDQNFIQRNHPHEKTIIKFENRWTDACFNELKTKLYEHKTY